MIDTLRLILFLECNMKCSYCCNEQEQFSSQFKKVNIGELPLLFQNYNNVCISGGEPFLNKKLLFDVLGMIPRRMKVFIYSNGLKIDSYDADNLEEMHIEALNIGIHNKNQIRHIKFRDFIYGRTFSTRIMVQNTKYHEFFKSLKNQSLLVTEDHIKTWQMNDCNMPNEDWMVLQ